MGAPFRQWRLHGGREVGSLPGAIAGWLPQLGWRAVTSDLLSPFIKAQSGALLRKQAVLSEGTGSESTILPWVPASKASRARIQRGSSTVNQSCRSAADSV